MPRDKKDPSGTSMLFRKSAELSRMGPIIITNIIMNLLSTTV